MIPTFSISGTLPPFVGQNPAERALCSPYQVTMTELVNRFALSAERSVLLEGLLDLRHDLARLGIANGTQWIDGSFVEDVEATQSRSPRDVDVVTLGSRPIDDPVSWGNLINANLTIFDSNQSKAHYGCDHYFIDIKKRTDLAIADSVYFFNLFSHQRTTQLWKGIIEIPLASDDALARLML